ncbi:MAG TPA: hypothetical protein DDW55_07340 [Gammaproteobacteria bacterium]|nr:hypothetical protein [Gammaproteobacteria bacterium]
MSETPQKKSYATLWVLIAVTMLPIAGAWFYYAFYDYLPHFESSNNGDLVTPGRPIEQFSLDSLDGQSYTANAFRGKWTLLTAGSSICLEQCEKNIYTIRQVRLATDRDRERVQRLFILDDRKQLTDFLNKLEGYEGMAVATGNRQSLNEFYAILDDDKGQVLDRIYIVDPLGNYMMSYPVGIDPELILEDLKRLLKVSKIG